MLILLATLASAQEAGETPALNAQIFHSSVDGRVGFSLDDTHVAPDRYATARAQLQYVNDPLVYVFEDGERVELLSDLLAVDILASYTFGRARVGIDMPLYLVTAGADLSGGVQAGDLSVDGKYVLLDPAKLPFGLAAVGRLVLPTGGNGAPVGDENFGWELGLAGSQTFGNWTVAANLGHRGVPKVQLENIDWGSQLAFRAGVSRTLGEKAGVSLELAGSSVYTSFFADAASSPVEGMLGGWYRVGPGAVARLGVGTGLTPGIGAPVARVIGSIAFEPMEIRDADKDGIVDKDDACPTAPEDGDGFEDKDGCPDPDNDKDGLADANDKCPNEAEDADTWKDDDGCPDPLTEVTVRAVDKTGLPVPFASVSLGDQNGENGMMLQLAAGTYPFRATAADWVPLADSVQIPKGPPVEIKRVMSPEIKGGTLDLRVTRTDGAPVDASWRPDTAEITQAPGGKSSTKLVPGKHDIHVFAAGYASVSLPVNITLGQTTVLAVVLQPAKVVVTTQKLDILDKVFFDTNKTTIKKVSYPLLDEVAHVLIDHPEILKVRVEGHTDSRGSDSANLKLSDGRARAVQTYLVKAGVAPNRLSAAGFGETRPVDPTENEAAWEKNRRVEFVIESRAE
jgi:outer membrane protein OmpA-like peptidoglycan-associated protein